jgi:hypothetical protein
MNQGYYETRVPLGPHRPGSWPSLTSWSDLLEDPPTCQWAQRPSWQPTPSPEDLLEDSPDDLV